MSARAHAWLARTRCTWIEPMVRGASRARTFGLAAEMSFWLFLSLVPLAAVSGWMAARVVTTRASAAAGLLSAVPPDARNLIQGEVQRVAGWRGSAVAPVALVTFVWLAASGVHAVFDALEVQAGASRPWWRQRLLALGTCVALSAGVALLGFLAVGLGRLEMVAGRAVPLAGMEATIAGSVLRAAAGLGIGVAMVAGVYVIGIPRGRRAAIPILPGALLAVVSIAAVGWGYRVLISTTGMADAYQGSLAVIGVTLTTLWLFSVALLLGAELNKVILDRRTEHCSSKPPAEEPLPRSDETWPTSDASSSPQTSPKPPIERSTGPSPLPHGSARP
jgi:membrane protein